MNTLEFYNEFRAIDPKLKRFAYKLTKNSDASRDLFQDTAYRALKNKDKFSSGTNFSSWCYTIMKNLFINDYRKKSRARMVFDDTPDNFFINSGKQTVQNQGDSNIMVKELTDLVNNLEDSYRVPFMRHFAGFRYNEIAEEMDLPLGTVKSRIFFARKILKEQIKNRYSLNQSERA